ncbi:uncharacterized protein LOC131666174 isoform X2 [Phymastichus coffea]|uniref:uncharacterized protein LOC131666174 isoform X2 n=1 Tax=Phymastichus coffea TaxID=108790 RepID=UPI00273BF125|nr:uncharacterized protein LOC131666174 isoform X2 [Phymastichus coffea]
MIYNHQAPTMSSASKTSPRPRHRNLTSKQNKPTRQQTGIRSSTNTYNNQSDRCRGRCRVQWSEQHVKEGLVLVQEAQLARVVKTGPITEHYDIEPKPFASGQWARVYKCRSRITGSVYAAKFSSRNRFNADCSAELRHEIALLSLCSQSPRVVRLHDVYETPKEIIMVMEFAPGGDLQTLIDGDLVPLEGDVVHFVRQLVEGLAYLHERNIAHLDIKPQNLVMMGSFPDCNVKLCDFEISRVVLEGTEVREILGTPDYVAPEILHYEPITLAADMWSLGVTTYVLLTGFSPFGGETDQETFKNIILGQADFPEELFEDISAAAKDFVARLLVLDPSARMTAKQCLRHEWLRQAPTQASAHLRKYLSKSREVLLERVVSRENLRKAALLGQTAANQLQQQQGQQQWGGSEMCLNRSVSMYSDDYESGQDMSSSRTSLADSLSSSKSSLAMSQSCLLNKEQTQGLLSQAQDRKSLRASMAQGLNRISVLSKIKSLGQTQSRSQACLPLLHGSNDDRRSMNASPLLHSCYFNVSREKLYGLKSLSKSQGMLDIYRSLESLQKHKQRDLLKQKQRSKTEDVLPFSRPFGHGSSIGSLASASSHPLVDKDSEDTVSSTQRPLADDQDEKTSEKEVAPRKKEDRDEPGAIITTPTVVTMITTASDEKNIGEEKPQSMDVDAVDDARVLLTHDELPHEMKSTGPSSLTVSETNFDSLQSMESDTMTDDSEDANTSRSLSLKQPSSTGSECHGRESLESQIEEPKFTVAQLVSAFNMHQEVASRSSLEAIMTEKRIADDSTNFPIGPKALRLFIPDIDISEKKPLVRRKTSYKPRKNWEELRKQNEKNEGLLGKDFFNDSGNEEDAEPEEEQPKASEEEESKGPPIDTNIDEKYKLCVEAAKINEKKAEIEEPPLSPASIDSGVNLRDILRKTDSFERAPKTNLEKLRERTNLSKMIVADKGLASKISVFSDKRLAKSPTRSDPKTRLHSITKDKLCTGSYVRAMEKFSNKTTIEKQLPRLRKVSSTTQHD